MGKSWEEMEECEDAFGPVSVPHWFLGMLENLKALRVTRSAQVMTSSTLDCQKPCVRRNHWDPIQAMEEVQVAVVMFDFGSTWFQCLVQILHYKVNLVGGDWNIFLFSHILGIIIPTDYIAGQTLRTSNVFQMKKTQHLEHPKSL